MAQQVLDGDLARRRHEIDGAARLHGHFGLCEIRQELRERIAKQDPAFLDERHRRHRDDRLRHRVDAEYAVWRHLGRALWIARAQALDETYATSTRQQGDHAGQALAVDLTAEGGRKPPKANLG